MFSRVSNGVYSFVSVVDSLVSDSDGFKKVSYLALSIFELMEKYGKQVPTLLTEGFTTFAGAAVFVALGARIKDWTCLDDDKKMFWQRSWQAVASTACLTASQVLTCLEFFSTLKLASLGRAVTKISQASGVFMMGACAFDAWCNVHTLQKIATIRNKAFLRRRLWRQRSNDIDAEAPGWWQLLVEKKIAKWDARRTDPNLDATAQARAAQKKAEWEILGRCDTEVIKRFCTAKSGKWNAVLNNQKIERGKTWLSVAVNVAFIALIAIGLFVTVPTTGLLMMSVALLSIGANAADITSFLLGIHMKTIPPANPVPG